MTYPCRYRDCELYAQDKVGSEYCAKHNPNGYWFKNLRRLFEHLRWLLDGYPKDEDA